MKNLMKTVLTAGLIATFSVATANAKVTIKGDNKQTAELKGGAINMAMGSGKAVQNVASNQGKVTIKGNNDQSATVTGVAMNMGMGSGKATQNLASNHGKVQIDGNNKQSVNITGAAINMSTDGDAIQNLSSNSSEDY
ncbi:hypothetical protein CBG46_03345 [Actinobacillus succinogenes]|uniref:Uncharacterized protein n=1 Tax=Actinobacillus succinogenes (strain ATCC 55618 / DSM 22257 / CCUG 43843 / 130Z) TaxID=339671 RepID=A6VLD0_ACTSZ|nr:hypothetical protein [Actinobacillus succinogenes]ABR73777.1 conserved hypothetical protein [Actinobacillus succinogenes 130Z]PHI39765.1 hypothetical protein CBG46_03345 [Actinobacillus succinogenes]